MELLSVLEGLIDLYYIYIYIKSNNYSENKPIKFLEKEKKNFPVKVYKVYISI